ncbi:MAG: hypothetical protein PVF17_02720 [Ignavibacteria bacterium]|jgi:hypothetical protein
MKSDFVVIIFLAILFSAVSVVIAQEDEPINYFQMEPLDDSLFIQIQQELFIDPPDPKAEIIADLRDANNQTISIRGRLYPFLAISPELRARVITYPFKINLEEEINYGSVFTRVIDKINISRVAQPPTKQQISSTEWYVNPFFQMYGGERFGLPIKKDVGLSFGIGTRYEGIMNTNYVEVNFHIIGAYAGGFTNVDPLIQSFTSENHNNLIVSSGYQIGYVFPLGNFLEISFLNATRKFPDDQVNRYLDTENGTTVLNEDSTIKYQARIVDEFYFNWEFRYPIKVLGSTKGRIYIANYLSEYHFGFEFREMSLAGSTFDFWFDAMPSSQTRQPQYVINLMVQKIAESWGFSSFSMGPSIILSNRANGNFGVLKIFVNFRLKIGTSL